MFIYCSICLSSHLTFIFFSLSKWKVSFSNCGQSTHPIGEGVQEHELWGGEAGSPPNHFLLRLFILFPYAISFFFFIVPSHHPLYTYFSISLLPVSLLQCQLCKGGTLFFLLLYPPTHRTVLGAYDVLSKYLLKFERF